MADKKTKSILAGVSVLLVVAVFLFVFKLTSDNSVTTAPSFADDNAETAAIIGTAKTPTSTVSVTKTGTPPSFTETPIPTPSITPTYAILTGRVNVDKLDCLSGPGPYVGLADLFRNNRVNVLGRDVTDQWLLVNFESSTGEAVTCWVEVKPVDLGGAEITSLEIYYPGKYQIPLWQDYKPPENIRISRAEDFVNILWDDSNRLEISERENGRSPQFIIEAWVCKEGVLEFTVLGILDNTNLIIEDQPGCTAPSSGLLYAAGKQGYSAAVDLDWPQP